jgi:hypothetical protein
MKNHAVDVFTGVVPINNGFASRARVFILFRVVQVKVKDPPRALIATREEKKYVYMVLKKHFHSLQIVD